MNVSPLTAEIAHLVESACRQTTNPFGYGIWSHHTVHVVRYAKQLARQLGADEEMCELAALLHDYAAILSEDFRAKHHLHGARLAGELLSARGYPPERIARLQHCILAHRGSQSVPRETLEAEILASADAMAHFDAVSSLLHFAYTRQGLSIDEGAQWVLRKLERSWAKLMPKAQELVREKHEAAHRLFTVP